MTRCEEKPRCREPRPARRPPIRRVRPAPGAGPRRRSRRRWTAATTAATPPPPPTTSSPSRRPAESGRRPSPPRESGGMPEMNARPSQEPDFDIRPTAAAIPAAQRAEMLVAPGFGSVFTDHMATIRWTEEEGWHDARIEPYGPITL